MPYTHNLNAEGFTWLRFQGAFFMIGSIQERNFMVDELVEELYSSHGSEEEKRGEKSQGWEDILLVTCSVTHLFQRGPTS